VTAPRILVRDDAKTRQKGAEPAPELGWYLLGGLGLVFVIAAGVDLALTWYPPNFGLAEWKFGTVTATLNGFPLIALGIILLTASAISRGRVALIRVMLVVLVVIVLGLVGCALLYLPEISTALASVSDPTVRMGLKRGITKTVVQLILYPFVLSWIAVVALRRLRSP
jgi:hypothetical protein